MFKLLFSMFAILHLTLAMGVHHENPNLRIIGGHAAVPNSVPNMVLMEIDRHNPNDPDDSEICGGSLISDRHILTAAHCVNGKKEVAIVILGAHNVTSPEPGIKTAHAEKVVIHKDFDKPARANDIAIVKLKSPVAFTDKIKKAALPTAADAGKDLTGKTVTAYGWGFTAVKPRPVEPEVLMTVDLKVISNADCLAQAPKKNVNPKDMCTDGNGPVGTCQGDSGSPLMMGSVQVGVTSRGVTEECTANQPSVFVRVVDYLDWIEATMKSL